MEVSGWGRYQVREAESISSDLFSAPFIARGSGRSYGDSSTATRIFDSTRLKQIFSFDRDQGLLVCEPGVTMGQILQLTVPAGWAPAVLPGTQYVSVGGALAGDIHGKNHVVAGCFSKYVNDFEILLGNGQIVSASRLQNKDLFLATCGGMGLTGIINKVCLQLQPLCSNQINERRIILSDLDSTLEALARTDQAPYKVAWVDIQAFGKNLGRSVVFCGEPVESQEPLVFQDRRWTPRVPRHTPDLVLNSISRRVFNFLYYQRHALPKNKSRNVSFNDLFFPLDGVKDWNFLYGRRGLIQYQCVLPSKESAENLAKVFKTVCQARQYPYLTVIKKFGPANQNLLSFPIEGFALAMDFKACEEVLLLLNQLDELVVNAGGRVNLTKDTRMSAEVFKASYPRWREFESVRQKYHAIQKFRSEQSMRLGLA